MPITEKDKQLDHAIRHLINELLRADLKYRRQHPDYIQLMIKKEIPDSDPSNAPTRNNSPDMC
jgi:hypothetical protein